MEKLMAVELPAAGGALHEVLKGDDFFPRHREFYLICHAGDFRQRMTHREQRLPVAAPQCFRIERFASVNARLVFVEPG